MTNEDISQATHHAPSDHIPVNASAPYEAQQPPVTHMPASTVNPDGSAVTIDSFGCVTVQAGAAVAPRADA